MIKNKDLVNFPHGREQNDFGQFQQKAKIIDKSLKILTFHISLKKFSFAVH